MSSKGKKSFLYFFTGIVSILIILALASSFSGCCITTYLADLSKTKSTESTTTGANETDTQETIASAATEDASEGETTASDQQSSESKLKEIGQKFDQLVTSGASTVEIFDFIDANIKDADPDLATVMVAKVIEISEEKKFDFTDKFTSQGIRTAISDALGGEYIVDMEMLKNTTNVKLKDLIAETISRKYKIISVEGFFMPIVDYVAYDAYREFITEEMNSFMDIYLDESVQPAVLDLGIVISSAEFLGRINKAFKFLADYPDSPRYANVKKLNAGRLRVYLGGIDNTPVFDHSNKIYPEKLAEFEDFAVKYEGAELGDILKSYLSLLSSENYIHTVKIDEFLQNF